MMRQSMGSDQNDEYQGSSKKQKIQSGLAVNVYHNQSPSLSNPNNQQNQPNAQNGGDFIPWKKTHFKD